MFQLCNIIDIASNNLTIAEGGYFSGAIKASRGISIAKQLGSRNNWGQTPIKPFTLMASRAACKLRWAWVWWFLMRWFIGVL